ncbi:MAG: GNAT family N-acetyltransferase [Chloroflexi bacterium]|nr:GNAT family N-acetyltransferase [Chloroflexota bacterium]
MVAQIVRQADERFQGVRPLSPARDLRQVALLLEEAFRDDLGALHAWARVPLLREFGATLAATAFMPVPTESLRGFVYEENGRILGNVTLTLDDSRAARWLISNVAVAEKFRRRGIARQLMQAAIDEARARNARSLILNVRPWNTGVQQLYEALGFQVVDTESQFVRTRARAFSAAPLALRRLRGSEYRAAYQLVWDSMGELLRNFHPPLLSDFAVHLEDRLAERLLDFFILQSTERWGYFQNDTLTALVTLYAQRLGTPHRLDIRVLPSARGELERGLVAAALTHLAAFPAREIQVRVLTSHTALTNALADAGFVPTRGLTLMYKNFRY